jgi:hemoglobin-like flavoprotein
MTSTQQEIVLDSWHLIEPQADRAAVLFFDRLLAIDPEAFDLFAHDHLPDRARMFRMMMAELVALHRDPRDVVARAAELGRRHVGYGVRDGHYRSMLDALLWVLEVLAPSLDAAAVHAAWNEAFALVAAIMRRAGNHGSPVSPPSSSQWSSS